MLSPSKVHQKPSSAFRPLREAPALLVQSKAKEDDRVAVGLPEDSAGEAADERAPLVVIAFRRDPVPGIGP
jgi:hypothetical protein